MSIPRELYNLKFAEYLEAIKILYLVDDQFKNLCDQYCESKTNVKKIEKKIEKDFYDKLSNENLSSELEEEILFYIIKSK